jgi:hypothetical protein
LPWGWPGIDTRTMTNPRFVLGLLLALASVGVFSGCSRGEAPENAGEPAQTERASTEITTLSEDDPFVELRARPIRAPALRPGAYCGTGPVYFAFPGIPRFLDFFPPGKSSSTARTKWRRAEVVWASDPSYSGPVLVRGHEVDGQSRVGFGTGDRPEFELRLPAGSWAEGSERLRAWGRTVRPEQGWRVAVVNVRVREGGCYFFQIDGKSFSERGILFGVIWQP